MTKPQAAVAVQMKTQMMVVQTAVAQQRTRVPLWNTPDNEGGETSNEAEESDAEGSSSSSPSDDEDQSKVAPPAGKPSKPTSTLPRHSSCLTWTARIPRRSGRPSDTWIPTA